MPWPRKNRRAGAPYGRAAHRQPPCDGSDSRPAHVHRVVDRCRCSSSRIQPGARRDQPAGRDRRAEPVDRYDRDGCLRSRLCLHRSGVAPSRALHIAARRYHLVRSRRVPMHRRLSRERRGHRPDAFGLGGRPLRRSPRHARTAVALASIGGHNGNRRAGSCASRLRTRTERPDAADRADDARSVADRNRSSLTVYVVNAESLRSMCGWMRRNDRTTSASNCVPACLRISSRAASMGHASL